MNIQNNDNVQVHYTGTLANGTQFDSSVGKEPLQVLIGAGQLIAGFENALMGMQEGEKKTITIPADEAYGQYQEELVVEVPRERLPQEDLQAGQMLQMRMADGRVIVLKIKEVGDETCVLDGNHDLAGKDLNFDLEIVKIERKS
ncbi:peptidylprolyl isomerase [Candidatus Nomurabacteria bacterium]|nr:peptidylprolyl isomerase [Candidatus Nomurabacteria bacterium]